jgi:hypothetical protein
VSGCNGYVNTITVLIGLTAVVTGLGGVLANLFYGEGGLALAGLAVSLATLALGFMLFYGGLIGLWRCSRLQC